MGDSLLGDARLALEQLVDLVDDHSRPAGARRRRPGAALCDLGAGEPLTPDEV